MAPVIITGTFFLLIVYYIWIPNLSSVLEKRVIELEQHELVILERLLLEVLDDGWPEVERILGELEGPDSVSYRILDQDGALIYQNGVVASADDDNFIQFSRPVIKEGNEVAELSLYVDVSHERNYLKQIFFIALQFLLVALVAIVWLQNRLVRVPLARLTETADLVSQGQFDTPIKAKPGNDEVSLLMNAFAIMQESLKTSQSALEDERNRAVNSLRALSDNQQKLHSFFENIPDGVVIVNADGDIEDCNPMALSLTGYSADELLDQHFDLILPDNHNLLTQYSAMNASGISVLENQLVVVVSESGEEFPAELSLFNFYQQDEPRYVFLLKDNSDRRLKEELLRNSEEKLRTIIENANNIICTMDVNRILTFLPPAWSELLGYSVTESLGHSLDDYICKQDATVFERALLPYEGDKVPHFEFRMQHKTGEERWFEGNGKLVNGGATKFYVVVLEDITERKKVMQALSESEERFRLLFDSMSQGVVVIDKEGEQLIANKAVDKILGMSYQELIKNIELNNIELINEQEEALEAKSFPPYLTMNTGTSTSEQVLGLRFREQSYERWVLMSSVAQVNDYNEMPNRVFITFADMTERRFAEYAVKDYVRYLNVMDRTNAIGLHATSMNEMLKNILQELLIVFDCKRSWLIYPCDPDETMLTLPMAYSIDSGEEGGVKLNVDESVRRMLDISVTCKSVTVFAAGQSEQIPPIFAEKYQLSTLLTVAIFPKTDKPWLLCLGYDVDQKFPSQQDGLILENIANRLADHITSFQSLDNLRDSEDSLKEAQKIGKIGNWSYDIASGSVYWSEQVYRIMGKDSLWFTPNQNSFLEVIHPDDRKRVYDYEQLARLNGGKYSYDFRAVLKGGGVHWVHAEVVTDTPSGTIPSKLRGTYQDITQSKLSEEQLKQTENQVRMILESAAEGIFGLDNEGRATFVNSSASEMLGYQADEIVGQPVHQLIHHSHVSGEAYPIDECPFQQALSEGVIQRNKNEILWRKSGSYFEVEYSVMPIRSDKLTLGAVVTFRDITEQLSAESERKTLQSQLQQAQKMDAIGQLTGGIAHDFNNMLASILGYSELAQRLSKDLSNATLTRYLDEIFKAGSRGRDLIEKMLAFSRGVDNSKPEPLLLEPLLNDVLKMLRSVIPASITIETEVEPNIPAVMVDTVNLQQIIMNLCINARDAMAGKGELHINIRHYSCQEQNCSSCHENFSGDYVELMIADTGCGIDDEYMARMFDPFFTTKEMGKGTGMGLSVVHGTVHSSGGHIKVSSKIGEGSAISIYLPPTEQSVDDEGASLDDIPEEMTQSGRILIVDDEPSVGNFLKELLQVYGYECDYMESPVIALEKVTQQPYLYQLLISDVTMPDMTGIDLTVAVKSLNEGLPVILCTGYSDKLTPEVEKEIGVLRVLKKPLNSLELLECVGEAIDTQKK